MFVAPLNLAQHKSPLESPQFTFNIRTKFQNNNKFSTLKEKESCTKNVKENDKLGKILHLI